MQSSSNHYDVVVVGSGVSGMSAALILARLGRKVLLVEQCDYVCPLLRRFQRGGVWCDPGLHYSGGLAEAGPLTRLFRYLGVMDDVRLEALNPEGYDELQRPDGEIVRMPYGLERLGESLCGRFPRSAVAVKAYLRRAMAEFDSTPFTSFGRAATATLRGAPRLAGREESLEQFLRAAGAEDGLRELLDWYGRFISGAPARVTPMRVHVLVAGSMWRAAHGFPRGGDELVDSFMRQLAKQGVEVWCGRGVEAILADDRRRLKGVRLRGGETVECGACVCTVHPRRLSELLPRGVVRPVYSLRLRELANTFAPFVVFLAADKCPPALERSNRAVLRPEGGVGSTCIMVGGATVREGKKKALTVVRELPSAGPGSAYQSAAAYGEYKERMTQEVVEDLLMAFPELRGKCRVVCAASPWTYERYTGTEGGAIYGAAQTTDQIGLGPTTSVRGLYLAGQSVGTPGVMGAAISAFVAATYIVGLETIWEELKTES